MNTCLLCRDFGLPVGQRNTRLFNIHNDYGNNNHTAKDDMLQFFGHQIESHLRPEDAICNHCMNIMENVAKLKKFLLPMIFRTDPSYLEDRKPFRFGKLWDILATASFDEELFQSRSPTPNNLLKCNRIVPYESPIEMKIAEIERHRSLSRVSSVKSDADSEIVNAFSKRTRRRKRGHNWSRRKNGRYSQTSTERRSNISTRQSTRSRPMSTISVMSTESYESFYPPALETSSPVTITPEETRLRYDVNGCLQNKRTRSVSRRQEEEVRLYFRGDELHQCCEEDCSFICEDIDLMVQHKVNRHRQLALFWCNYCQKKYTSSGDLEIHKKTHSQQYSCVICRKEFDYDYDLKEHWQEHVKKAVPCKYCGKKFVDKNVCNKHQRSVHKRNIPSRIDYKGVEQNSRQSKDFQIKILVQDGTNFVED